MSELLKRYSDDQRKIIDEYWAMIKNTRKSYCVSFGIQALELQYWARFEPDVVIEALVIHIDAHQDKKERYTRGIMRNIAAERALASSAVGGGGKSAGRSSERSAAPARRKKSRFANFDGRKIDYEAVLYIEELQQTGQLEGKRAELEKDERYKPYL
jgi:hypothetical protein